MADPSQYAAAMMWAPSIAMLSAVWTAAADFIILDRLGGVNQTLVASVPRATPKASGTELLNADDLHQGFSAGARGDLICHGDAGCDLEFSYFQIDGWGSDYSSRRRSGQPADNAGSWGLCPKQRRPSNAVAVCLETL